MSGTYSKTAAVSIIARTIPIMTRILPETVEILLLAVEYDQSVVDGPPHSVSTDEVEALFGGRFGLRRLYLSEPSKPDHPRLAAAGLEAWQEAIWRISRTPGGPTGRLE